MQKSYGCLFFFFCLLRASRSKRRKSSCDFPSACCKQTKQVRPTTNRGMQKWDLSFSTYTLHTRFFTFGADLYAQSVIINKISATELSRKLIKSALLVGRTIES